MANGTKVVISGIPEIRDQLLKVIKDTEQDAQMLQEVGTKAVTYIQGQVRANRTDYKTKNVSDSWTKQREKLKPYNPVDSAYRKSKPLDFTGEWISSLTFSVSSNSVDLYFKGDHTPYKNAKGEAKGDKVTNAQIYVWLAEQGRDILFLSDTLKKLLSIEVVRNVRRRIKLFKALSNSLKNRDGE